MSRRPAGALAASALFSAFFAVSPQLGANDANGQAGAGVQHGTGKPEIMEMEEAKFKAQAAADFVADLTKRIQDACGQSSATPAGGVSPRPDGGVSATPPAIPARTGSARSGAPASTPPASTATAAPAARVATAGTHTESGPAADPAAIFGETLGTLCKPGRNDFLIALVPDPVHTHLALDFDRLIEVIQEATQDSGFQFVGADLPWDAKAHPESDDIAVRLSDHAYKTAKENFPGLLTFRGPSAHKPLFVWLVGESPTGGIARKQFSQAMKWVAAAIPEASKPAAPPPAASEPPPPLRILGPNFSGSLRSLTELLTPGENPPAGPVAGGKTGADTCLVFSGSITNRSSINAFLQWENGRPVRFATFQEADDVLIERFKEYLTGRAYGNGAFQEDSIAVLSEDETEYGMNGGGGTEPPPSLGCRRCTWLHFPREISRLRAAYQGVDARNGEAQGGPYTILPLNLEISGADDDTVAPYSKQSPLSQEGVLLSIVSELRKHAIQFIILRATDPIDVLFLSRYLGAAYPKARIVTLGADVLFSREIDDKQLHGVLALSTYSLAASANHEFISQEQSERLFPSSNDTGSYNALRALLTAPRVDSATPPSSRLELDAKDLHLYQYGWLEPQREDRSDLDPNTPPANLLALSRDGYWPIAHLGPFAGEQTSTLLPKVSAEQLRACVCLRARVPISWIAAELLALLLTAGFALALWRSSVRSPSQFAAALSPAAMDASAAMIAPAALALAGILALLLIPLLRGGDWVIPGRGLLAGFLIAGLGALLVVTLFDLASRCEATGIKAWPWLGGAVGLGALVSWWIASSGRQAEALPTGAWRFEVLRSLQLTSGVSPILPLILLLAAWLWWAFQISSGIALVGDRRPQLPKGVHDVRVLAVAEGAADDWNEGNEGNEGKNKYTSVVTELIETLTPSRASAGKYALYYALPGGLIAAGLLDLAAFSPRAPWPLMTLDAATYQSPLMFLLWLAVAGIAGTTLHIWDVWLKARRFLVMLDSFPLRRGFKALEGFSWQPLWRVSLASLEELQRLVAREREALEAASNMGGESLRTARAQVEHDRNLVREKYGEVLAVPRPFLTGWHLRRCRESGLIEQYEKLQNAIARAAGGALDRLADAWQQEKAKPRRSATKETVEETSLRACERFVCLVYASFLMVVLVRLRTLILAAGGMYIFLLIAMTVYPFQPRASIVAILALLLLGVLAVVTLVFAQAHRNAILSNLTDTKPGALGADFWVRLTSFAALPLVAFFASQFPQLNRLLSAWLEPALQALNK
jgi:hypothetical protein